MTEKIAVACLSAVTSSFSGDGIKKMDILNFGNLDHWSVIGYFLSPIGICKPITLCFNHIY